MAKNEYRNFMWLCCSRARGRKNKAIISQVLLALCPPTLVVNYKLSST